MRNVAVSLIFVLALSLGCQSQTCLESAKEIKPPLSPETREKFDRDAIEAWIKYGIAPEDPNSLIWPGRRRAYLGNYKAAIRDFSDGIARFPKDVRFTATGATGT